MAQKPPSPSNRKSAPSRDERLKTALKANLARRKAQARARSGDEAGKPGKTQG